MTPHLSPNEIAQWVSGVRNAEQEHHVGACRDCAAEVGEVEKTLALFRESGRCWSDHWLSEAPPAPRRQPHTARLVTIAAAAFAAIALAAVLWRPWAPRRMEAAAAPFVDFPYVAPLAPYERVEIVRMNVSVAALQEAGLEVRARDTGATVLADLVLGQDGRAHAVRFVSQNF